MKMQLFNLGETVIDTRTHNTAIVVSIIPQGENSITDIYVLDDDGNLYLSDDTHLIVYDKYYWDDIDTMNIKEVLD
jgi:hypothetical protein